MPMKTTIGEKSIPPGKAAFFKADAIALDSVPAGCNAAFAGFWWSHVKKSELALFVKNLSLRLEPGSLVAILDNSFAAGSSTPISRTDAEGNTYQSRRLGDGSTHEVLKNFPSRRDLEARFGSSFGYTEYEYYWLATYRIMAAPTSGGAQ